MNVVASDIVVDVDMFNRQLNTLADITSDYAGARFSFDSQPKGLWGTSVGIAIFQVPLGQSYEMVNRQLETNARHLDELVVALRTAVNSLEESDDVSASTLRDIKSTMGKIEANVNQAGVNLTAQPNRMTLE